MRRHSRREGQNLSSSLLSADERQLPLCLAHEGTYVEMANNQRNSYEIWPA